MIELATLAQPSHEHIFFDVELAADKAHDGVGVLVVPPVNGSDDLRSDSMVAPIKQAFGGTMEPIKQLRRRGSSENQMLILLDTCVAAWFV